MSDQAIIAAGTDWFVRRVLPRTVRDSGGCLLWGGSLDGTGYGKVWTPTGSGRRLVQVHRAALVLDLGEPLPDGWQVDHLCRVRRCLAVNHLEAVTGRVNRARGVGPSNAGVAARMATGLCPRGHDAWVRGESPDGWRCAECRRIRNAKWRKPVV